MQRTKIEWTDHSENPVMTADGSFYCVKISPGCKNCYAEGQASRLSHMRHVQPVPYQVRREIPRLVLRRDILAGWAKKTKPARRFVSSMTDIFADFVPEEWSIDMLEAMAAAPLQTFQILSKRTQHMASTITTWLERTGRMSVPANIWVGTSVEDQARAAERLPILVRIPAAVLWISAEPLLEHLSLRAWLPFIQWVVVGGESGHKARPAHPFWFASLRDQCFDCGTPFFFKQWGEWHPDHLPGASSRMIHMGADGTISTTPQLVDRPDLIPLYRIGKANAGHVLDGHTWHNFPTL